MKQDIRLLVQTLEDPTRVVSITAMNMLDTRLSKRNFDIALTLVF